MQVEHTNKL